jgi:hypothetical protein
MLLTKQAARDGIHIETFLAEEEYEIAEPLASMLVAGHFAEPADAGFVPVLTSEPVVLAETAASARARTAAARATETLRQEAEEKAMQRGAPENKALTDAERRAQAAEQAAKAKTESDAKIEVDRKVNEEHQVAPRRTRQATTRPGQ